jgi:hypothetical protein
MAFGSTVDAVEWCMEVQQALMTEVDWPKALLDHPGAAEEWDDINQRYVSATLIDLLRERKAHTPF